MVRREAVLLLAAATLSTGGCIQHRAAIDPDPEQPASTVVEVRGAHPTLAEPIARTDPLPLELRASAVRRDADGAIWRDEIGVTTPLPWWQRFPADIVTDLFVPRTFIVEARATIDTRRVEPIDAETLFQLASEHGYAGGQVPVVEE